MLSICFILNRIKSVSLEEVANANEQWYGQCNAETYQNRNTETVPMQLQPPKQALQRQPSIDSKWRVASKHLLGGQNRRVPGIYDRSTQMGNAASHPTNASHINAASMINAELPQQGTGEELNHLSNHPRPQARTNYFPQRLPGPIVVEPHFSQQGRSEPSLDPSTIA